MSWLLSWPIVLYEPLLPSGSTFKSVFRSVQPFFLCILCQVSSKEKTKLDSRLSKALYSIKNVFLLPLFPLLYFFLFLATFLRCPCTGSTCPSCVAHLDVGPTSAPDRPPAHLTPRLAPPINVPLLKRAPYLTSCDWMPLPNANLHDQCSTMPVYQSQTAVAQSGMSHQLLPHCLIRKRTHVFDNLPSVSF